MKVLLGTTNPSKVKRFSKLLENCDIEFITLKDLEIEDEPDETGKTPEENAICKAGYYGKYFDLVICNDSGLYFEELSLEDERQPGLNVRTPMGMNRLSDEEMIEYYSNLISTALPEVLPENVTVSSCEPWYASESFSCYRRICPSVLAHLGINNPSYGSGAAHHNGFFDVDEGVLSTGVISTLKFVAMLQK